MTDLSDLSDLPDPRSGYLDRLYELEKSYAEHLDYLESKIIEHQIVDEKLVEDVCFHVEEIANITKDVTKVVIDVKLHEVVRNMLTDESDLLNLKIECTLNAIHTMMTAFNEYTDRIRNLKKLNDRRHIDDRIEQLIENIGDSKKKREIRRLLRQVMA